MRLHRAAPLIVIAASLLLTCTGCNILGAAAQVLPPPKVGAAYSLKGEKVGVMVWVDPGIALDYPSLRSDLARTIQMNFNQAVQAKNKDLEGTQFLDPARVVQYQEMHPELEGLPVTEIAPRLGVTRVISVQVSSFDTRSNLYLLKGNAMGTVQVAQVTGGEAKSAKIAFSSSDLHSTFPPTDAEGLAANDTNTVRTVYEGTVGQFGADVAETFYGHSSEGK